MPGVALPVWRSVRSSNVSSWVPKPPGRHTKADDSLMSMSFRVKKYFIATSRSPPARMSLGASSKGSWMLMPIARSGPAPSAPACMIPGPAPVITYHPASARCSGQRLRLRVERVV